MAFKPINFEESISFTRPQPADYEDQNGDTQTAPPNVPRFGFTDGEFDGMLVDSLLNEEINITSIENFSAVEGAFILEAEMDRCLPFPGSGFDKILSGKGKIYFVYSNGVGKCYANGEVLYTVSPITVSEPTAILTGGLGKIIDCKYWHGFIDEITAKQNATGVFEIEDVWDFEEDYKNQTFGSKDDRGAFIIRRFEDEHTFSRPSTKWALMDNGFYKEYASGEPAFDRAGLNLEKSSTGIAEFSFTNDGWTGGKNIDDSDVASVFEGASAARFTVTGAANPHRNQKVFSNPAGEHITTTWIIEQGSAEIVNLNTRSKSLRYWAILQQLRSSTGELTAPPAQKGLNVSTHCELLSESGPNGGRVYLVETSVDIEEGEAGGTYNRLNLPAAIGESTILHYCNTEVGNTGTSPIETTGAGGTGAVTRAQDVLTIEDLTSKSWWGSIVGRTLYFELIPRYSSQDADNSEVGAFYIRAENTPNEYLAYRSVNGNNTLGWTVYDSNGYVAGLGAQIEKDTLHRVAVSVYEDKIIAGVNGNISTIEHNMSYASSFDVVSLNSNLGLASGCGDFIAFAVKEGNATQAELELLTTQ